MASPDQFKDYVASLRAFAAATMGTRLADIDMPAAEGNDRQASRFIAQGGFGCAFREGMGCFGPGPSPPGSIIKLFASLGYANQELLHLLEMEVYDPTHAFTVRVLGACKVPAASVPRHECDLTLAIYPGERPGNHMYQIIMTNGGMDLYHEDLLQRHTFWHVFSRLENVFEGLAVLQARGVMHSDIKPTNILMDFENGRGNLIDFGLCAPFGLGPFDPDVSVWMSEFYPPEVCALSAHQGVNFRKHTRALVSACYDSYASLLEFVGLGDDHGIDKLSRDLVDDLGLHVGPVLDKLKATYWRAALSGAMQSGTFVPPGMSNRMARICSRLDSYGMGCTLLYLFVAAAKQKKLAGPNNLWLEHLVVLMVDLLSPLPLERPTAVDALARVRDIIAWQRTQLRSDALKRRGDADVNLEELRPAKRRPTVPQEVSTFQFPIPVPKPREEEVPTMTFFTAHSHIPMPIPDEEEVPTVPFIRRRTAAQRDEVPTVPFLRRLPIPQEDEVPTVPFHRGLPVSGRERAPGLPFAPRPSYRNWDPLGRPPGERLRKSLFL